MSMKMQLDIEALKAKVFDLEDQLRALKLRVSHVEQPGKPAQPEAPAPVKTADRILGTLGLKR